MPHISKSSGRVLLAALLVPVLAVGASFASEISLRVVSSDRENVSGGSALVQLSAPIRSKWSASLNGRDVTGFFSPGSASGDTYALLVGLKEGRNALQIRVAGEVRAKLTLVEHAARAAIFAGTHQEPFICETEANGLGPALDSDCNAKTIVKYYYKSTQPILTTNDSVPSKLAFAPGFKAYDPLTPIPSDLAQTITSDGRTVAYIVRREIGTLNRAVYDIQFLHQPGQRLPTPWAKTTEGWNGRLVYIFNGGCGAGFRQGRLEGPIGADNDLFLSQGYATATSTFNVFENNCNDRLSAETLSRVKERFIKQFGEPVHTIGWGPSAGAIQLYLTAQNYPGLLDGIIPYVAFPDEVSTLLSVTDCQLLDHALRTSTLNWTSEQKTAVMGWATWKTCSLTDWARWRLIDPRADCDPVVPKSLIYDPVVRPNGIRCDVYDNEIEVFGRNPSTGFAWRPLDNVGVQYGLTAFNNSLIDAEHFIYLNERIGGYDDDGNIVSQRSEANADAIGLAYRRGLVLTGGGGLRDIPVIEWRRYADDFGDPHSSFESFVVRARLIADHGDADNHVMLTFPRYTGPELSLSSRTHSVAALLPEQAQEIVQQMGLWLDNITADRASGTTAQKVIRNKPSDLADGCWSTAEEHIVERITYDGAGRCHQLYPPHSDPRIAAGGPLTDDILKCALKPIHPTDYRQALTADQLARLRQVFPTGVCDYSRPGIGKEVTTTTWQRF